MLFYLFLLFLIVPLVELWLLIEISEKIGLQSTVALVILTAFLGSAFVRQQGLRTLARLREQMAQGALPDVLLEGMFILGAGLLLLTPGIITDVVGFSLLIPPLRRAIAAQARKRLLASVKSHVSYVQFGGPQAGGPFQQQEAPQGEAGEEIIIEAEDVRHVDDPPQREIGKQGSDVEE